MSIFEKATRLKLRYNSSVGKLSTEDLWDLPLKSGNKANLNDVAKHISRSLKGQDEENFVDTNSEDKVSKELRLKLEIVKSVIAHKIKSKESAEKSAETKALKQRLVGILAKKQDEKLEGMSEEDILKKINELT